MSTARSSTIPGLAPPPPPPSRVAVMHRHLLLDVVHNGASWDRATRRRWIDDVLTPAIAGVSGQRVLGFADDTWTQAWTDLRNALDDLVAHKDGFVHAAVYKGIVVRASGDWGVDATKVNNLSQAFVALLARDVLRRRSTYDDELTICAACRRYRFVHWEQRATRPCPCRRRTWGAVR